MSESEWKTRKLRIDPRLQATGWNLAPGCPSASPWPTTGLPKGQCYRREEDPTENGPADYTLCDGPTRLAVVEAKKVAAGVQEVMKQAERYAKGATENVFTFGNYFIPFLYATNGESIWFRDVRFPENLQRTVRAFHTPEGLRDLLNHDVAERAEALADVPFNHAKLRDYQRDANVAIEAAVVARKRRMLVEMATGTGKTFTMVHLVARLMSAGVVRRVLFLVDRRALAAQAIRAFQSFDLAPGSKFHKNFEVYSQKLAKEDVEDDDGVSFDPNLLPETHLTQPKPEAAFVYDCTVQRMAMNVLGSTFDGVEGEGGDEKLTAALLDRLAENAVVIATKGASYRARRRAKQPSDGGA